MSYISDGSRCEKCGKMILTKHLQCFQCRHGIKKCAFPCCQETFKTSGDRKYCSKHNGIEDREAYLARRNSLQGYKQIRNSGKIDLRFIVALTFFSIGFAAGIFTIKGGL